MALPIDIRQLIIKNTKNNIARAYGINAPQVIIYETLSQLAADGYALNAGGASSLINDCEALLHSLGFVPVEKDKLHGDKGEIISFSKDFTLAKTMNVDQTINNAKIVDPDLSDLTPEPTETKDKFKSQTDSFYELDDDKTDNIKIIENTSVETNKKLFKISSMLASTARVSKNKMIPFKISKAKGILP